jgi:hypothetical protein
VLCSDPAIVAVCQKQRYVTSSDARQQAVSQAKKCTATINNTRVLPSVAECCLDVLGSVSLAFAAARG